MGGQECIHHLQHPGCKQGDTKDERAGDSCGGCVAQHNKSGNHKNDAEQDALPCAPGFRVGRD
jgi:hypothetical protein